MREPPGLRAAALVAAIVLVAGAGSAGAGRTLAADPSAPPTITKGTCAERYPETGPGGVDLRLGCIVSELVGAYTAGQSSDPPALSAYLIAVAVALGLAVVAFLLVTRELRARAGRRLAPVTPESWWQCATCRSINRVDAARCYSCGAARTEGQLLTTDEAPATPQSFGRGKRG